MEIDSLPEIGDFTPRRPVIGRIASSPKPPGESEDPLEKQAAQNVPGTLPERIVWKWLEKEGHIFQAQSSEMGGRLVAGGAVVDFVVWTLAFQPVVLRVQGDYWHGPSFPDRPARDDEQSARLRSQGYLVADLIESEIYQAALYGRIGEYILDQIGQ